VDDPLTQPEPAPGHVRPWTLHTVVVCLWVAVGTFGGLGIASTIGTVQLLDRRDAVYRISEYLAEIGSRAGPYFGAAVVALGAIAVVEAILMTLGHVQHIEDDLEATPPELR
jgi:hypothetical protein